MKYNKYDIHQINKSYQFVRSIDKNLNFKDYCNNILQINQKFYLKVYKKEKFLIEIKEKLKNFGEKIKRILLSIIKIANKCNYNEVDHIFGPLLKLFELHKKKIFDSEIYKKVENLEKLLNNFFISIKDNILYEDTQILKIFCFNVKKIIIFRDY